VFLAEVLDPTEVIYRANRQFDVMTTVDHYLYRKINVAREENPALQETKRYYLSKKSNGQFNQDIFSIARWTGSGSSANIVLAFVNLRDWVVGSDSFAIPSAVSIDSSKTYQCYNLTGNPNQALWGSGRTGADILANGVWVGFNYANEIQYLKLVALN